MVAYKIPMECGENDVDFELLTDAHPISISLYVNHNIYIYTVYIYIWYMLLQQKNTMESSENHKNRGFPFPPVCFSSTSCGTACLHRCVTSATPRLEPQNTWGFFDTWMTDDVDGGMHSTTISRATVETHGSKVVSTHLWNTPLNLYQQAMKGFLS